MSSLWEGAGNLLLGLLQLFYNLTSSWGMAIILLTVLVRLALHPLTHKQLSSMQKMQKLQPRMKVLQEKYGDDKQKLNQEVAALYKENGVNPLAGCLPLLAQMPLLILLFQILSKQNFGGSSFFGIHLQESPLTSLAMALNIPKETAGIMTILNGIASNPAGLANYQMYLGNLLLLFSIGFLMWWQQKLTSSSTNAAPQMAFMNWFMPVMLTFLCLSLPGGVLLYWAFSSFIGIGQQQYATHRTEIEIKTQEKPKLFSNKPPVKEADSNE